MMIISACILLPFSEPFHKTNQEITLPSGPPLNKINKPEKPPLTIPTFILSKQVAALIKSKTGIDKKIILKLVFIPETTSSPSEWKLQVYWAKDQLRHGQPEGGTDRIGPWTLRPKPGPESLTIDVGTEIIFGNNYIMLSDLKAIIAQIPSNQLEYVQFRPERSAQYDNHIVFVVEACSATQCLPLSNKERTTTKPSPPAPPGP